MDKNNMSPKELDELYSLARKAAIEQDYDKALEYYEKIVEVNSNDWEAVFYSDYTAFHPPFALDIHSGNFKDVEKQVKCMGSLLLRTVDVIAAQQGIDKLAAASEIYTYYEDHYADWYRRLKSQAESLAAGDMLATSNGDSIKTTLNYIGCLAMLYGRMSYEFGDAIMANGLNCPMSSGSSIAADCWKKGNFMIGFSYGTEAYPDYKFSQNKLGVYTAKIQQLEPYYQPPIIKQPTKKSGCYIATCVYGSYDCPQVWTLRRYRDNTLAQTAFGRAFIRAYYAVSPTLVRLFGSSSWFKGLFRPMLDRMVKSLKSKGFKDTPYRDQ